MLIPPRYSRKQATNGGTKSHGAERTTRHLTDQQLAQQSNQQGSHDRSLLLSTIQSLLNSTGYTPQQQSDITQQSLGAANTALDALQACSALLFCRSRTACSRA
jgi:hypothetical protein